MTNFCQSWISNCSKPLWHTGRELGHIWTSRVVPAGRIHQTAVDEEEKVICSFLSVHRPVTDSEKASCCKHKAVKIKMTDLTHWNVLESDLLLVCQLWKSKTQAFLFLFFKKAFELFCQSVMDNHLPKKENVVLTFHWKHLIILSANCWHSNLNGSTVSWTVSKRFSCMC